MRKRPRKKPEHKELDRLHREMEKDVKSWFVPSGDLVRPERVIHKSELEPIYNRISEAVGRYKRKPSFENLIALHDEVQMFLGKNDLSRETTNLIDHLRTKIAESKQVKRIKAFWEKVDPKNLWIEEEDLEQLSHLSSRPRGDFIPEYSGGAELVRQGNRLVIKPILSHIHLMESMAAIFFKDFFASKAELMWHTHPQTHPGVSRGDVRAAEALGIPMLLISRMPAEAEHSLRGEPVIQITLNGEVYSVRVLKHIEKGVK